MQLLLDYLGSILSNGKDFYFKKNKTPNWTQQEIETQKDFKTKKPSYFGFALTSIALL